MGRYTPKVGHVSFEEGKLIAAEIVRTIDEVLLLNKLKDNLEIIGSRELTSLESTAIRMMAGTVALNRSGLSLALESITIQNTLDATVSLENVGGMLKQGVNWIVQKVKEFFAWLKKLWNNVFVTTKRAADECRKVAKEKSWVAGQNHMADHVESFTKGSYDTDIEFNVRSYAISTSSDIIALRNTVTGLNDITKHVLKDVRFDGTETILRAYTKLNSNAVQPMTVTKTGTETEPRAKIEYPRSGEPSTPCKIKLAVLERTLLSMADGLNDIHRTLEEYTRSENKLIADVERIEQTSKRTTLGSFNSGSIAYINALKLWIGYSTDVMNGYFTLTRVYYAVKDPLISALVRFDKQNK